MADVLMHWECTVQKVVSIFCKFFFCTDPIATSYYYYFLIT